MDTEIPRDSENQEQRNKKKKMRGRNQKQKWGQQMLAMTRIRE